MSTGFWMSFWLGVIVTVAVEGTVGFIVYSYRKIKEAP